MNILSEFSLITLPKKTLILSLYSLQKIMKKILILTSISLFLIGCTESSNENDAEKATTSAPEEDVQEETGDIYAQDWESFKQAVISKDKDAVLFFAVKQDQSLRDILELSYDYIFDDQMIENIENMNYQDLPVSADHENWRELSTYYYGEVDGEVYESGTFLYFEERPEGLRIVNFLAAG